MSDYTGEETLEMSPGVTRSKGKEDQTDIYGRLGAGQGSKRRKGKEASGVPAYKVQEP